jgi:hypothetical protein
VTEDKDERRLLQIRSDAERIQSTVKAHGPDAFLEDPDVQDAIIMRLYRISNLTSRLTDELQRRPTRHSCPVSGQRIGKGLQDPEGALYSAGDGALIEFEQDRPQTSDQ